LKGFLSYGCALCGRPLKGGDRTAISLTIELREKQTIIYFRHYARMPDPLRKTRHPSLPVQLHAQIKPQHLIPRATGHLSKFAHLAPDVSSTLGPHGSKLSMMIPVGNFHLETIAI